MRWNEPVAASALIVASFLVTACGDDAGSSTVDAAIGAIDGMPSGPDGMAGPDGMPGSDAMAAVCGAGATSIVINEIRYDLPGNNDAGNEWVELHNVSGASIDIGNWTLEWGASSFSSQFSIAAATLIPADGYYVIGGSDVVGADVATATLVNLSNAATAPDGVRLLDASATVIDTVLYGDPGENTDNWVDDCGPATTWAPGTFSSESLARIPNGQDTDSGTDLQGDGTPTMGASNDG